MPRSESIQYPAENGLRNAKVIDAIYSSARNSARSASSVDQRMVDERCPSPIRGFLLHPLLDGSPSSLKLATSSYTWGKLQSEEETGAMLDEVVEAGLRYLALQPADLLPGPMLDDPGIFQDQARSRGIEIIALGGLAHDLNSRLAGAYGVDLMWAVVDGSSMDDWVSGSLALAGDVSALNVTLNVHPHLKSPLESLEEIKEFFSRVRASGHPEIRMCLDPGHYAGAHVDVLKVIDEFRDDIGMVHITDFLPPASGRPIIFEETFVDVGEGVVDYPPILRKLVEVGYDGWYIIEAHFPKNRTPMETVRLNRERFEDLMARSS